MRKLIIVLTTLLFISMAQGQNVGIGISSPTAKLDIAGNNNSGTKSLQLRSGNDAFGNSGSNQILFGYNGTDNYLHAIKTRHGGAGLGNAIDFYLWNPNNTPTQIGTNLVMTLDGTGKVGIGTSAPSNNLSVVGNADFSGNVGIGTVSPAYKFEVQTDGIGISQSSPNGLIKAGFYVNNAAAYFQTHTNNPLYFSTNNGSAQVTLSTNGNFGIGTTTPSNKLSVSGTSDIQVLGVGTTSPDASAVLDASSTTKGFLPPRMTRTQRNVITPIAGLMIYNTTTNRPNYYNGTEWKNFDETLVIGDNYQGGIVAYILQPGDPGYITGQTHGLIAAESDQSTGTVWGCVGTPISGADGTALGTGNQNTIDIMAGCAEAGIAARICGDLVLNGYSDWYLPSKDELNKLYINRVAIGGLSPEYYWSSSESVGNEAWYQNIGNGGQNDVVKTFSIFVRAIRAF